MSTVMEQVTVTMPADMSAAVKQAVMDGDYASTNEVVRDALREWETRRRRTQGQLAALKEDIEQGLADIAAGRVEAFDLESVIAQGTQRLTARCN